MALHHQLNSLVRTTTCNFILRSHDPGILLSVLGYSLKENPRGKVDKTLFWTQVSHNTFIRH